jgi:hypothetical protein
MKDPVLIGLLGIGAYLLFTRTASAAGSVSYPTIPGSPYRPSTPIPSPTGGQRTPGSGASGGGMPSGGVPGQTSSRGSQNVFTCPSGLQVTDLSQCPVDESGYVTCSDGSLVNDASLCPVDTGGYITCSDGSLVNDASLCPGGTVADNFYTCDDGSQVSDPAQCPPPYSIGPTGDPTDWGYL